MQWCFWPLGMLWKVLGVRNWMEFVNGLRKETEDTIANEAGKVRNVRFYSGITAGEVHLYQEYMNRAFALCPSLEFEPDDPDFERLLEEAETVASLSKLNLEIMRLQYIFADKGIRKDYRSMWAITVIRLESTGFFPSPWEILSTLFAGDTLPGKDTLHPVRELA